jgi:hypothetical protein
MAWTLVSKATVATLHQLDTNDLQDVWSNWVEALIQEHMGYESIGVTTTITGEKLDGNGTPILYVKKPPIVSVTSLSIGSPISSTSYEVYADYIQLVGTEQTALSAAIYGGVSVFPKGQKNITISYESGLVSVPPLVEFAAAEMIAEITKFYQSAAANNNTKFLPTRVNRDGRDIMLDRGLAATVKGIMATLLRKRVIALG